MKAGNIMHILFHPEATPPDALKPELGAIPFNEP
jgi:hypothetical protein